MTVDYEPSAAALEAAREEHGIQERTYGCPACASSQTEVFFAMRNLPVHGQAVCVTREAALALARGDQVLAVCHDCSFVFNVAYDPDVLDYSGAHEESQAFSPAFGPSRPNWRRAGPGATTSMADWWSKWDAARATSCACWPNPVSAGLTA